MRRILNGSVRKLLAAAAVWQVSAFAGVSSLPAAHGFGQTTVSPSAPIGYTVSGTFTGVSGTPKFALAYGLDFTIGSTSCSGASTLSCSAQVTFNPHSLGLRSDALLVTDQNGNSLATVFLYGIGQAAQIALFPGTSTSFAGTGLLGYSGNGGLATQATLFNPTGLAIDQLGNIYIADTLNQVVRKVNASTGVITTVAGNGAPGFFGDGGPATQAWLNNPTGVAVDGAGNLYIADQGNNRIRKVTATGLISTFAGGGTAASQSDGLGDGGPAASALLWGPNDVAVDPAGNVYIADSYDGLVREVNASSGIITVVAGGGSGGGSDGFGDGESATVAVLDDPSGVAVDANGNLYIADSGHSLVRKVNASGTISVVAGNGAYGYSGDLGPATSAELSDPVAVRVDAAGNVYIADAAINFIRVVSAANGLISTLTASTLGSATMQNPGGLALDSEGDIYVSSTPNNMIVEITPSAQPVTFGTVNVGQASQPFLVTALNVGNAPLTFSGLSLTTGFEQAASGSTDCSASLTVSAGAACFVAVEFAPASSGVSGGSLVLSSNSIWEPAEAISLSGTGVNGPSPQVVLSPTAVSFGNVATGAVSTGQTISLSNTGTAALGISFITLSGANASDFSLASNCGATLAANASCGITIVFSPAATGTRSAVVSLSDSAGSSPQTISLTGTGVLSASAAANPSTIGFGSQVLGKASAAQSITFTNTGNTSLSAPTLALSGANPGDFQVANNCVAMLPSGASCTVSVTFMPAATGSRNAVLTFIDSAANSPQSVALSGSGTTEEQISVSPASLNFGVVTMGGQLSQLVTVSNSGPAAVEINSTTVNGANSDEFTLAQSTCGASLPANQSCSMTLRFSPVLAGSLTASLNISDSSGSTAVAASLAGTGVHSFVFKTGNIAAQAVFRPWDGGWWLNSGSLAGSAWGTSGDIPAPADFDGDGRDDLTVFRPSTGTWWIEPSSNPGAFISQAWGQAGDVPVPGDYDGDGKADLAIWRPSTGTWLIQPSANSSAFISETWGTTDQIPVPGDYDGDGKTDIAIWDPASGMWWLLPSSKPGTTLSQYWGQAGDIPVPADYDGDGKTDFAVWRPSSGYWLIMPSSRPGSIVSEQFGLPGDIPVPGDYNGTGKAEIAIWRPNAGYLFPSAQGHAGVRGTSTQWLLAGEIP